MNIVKMGLVGAGVWGKGVGDRWGSGGAGGVDFAEGGGDFAGDAGGDLSAGQSAVPGFDFGIRIVHESENAKSRIRDGFVKVIGR